MGKSFSKPSVKLGFFIDEKKDNFHREEKPTVEEKP
jgi:hypothetical protein